MLDPDDVGRGKLSASSLDCWLDFSNNSPPVNSHNLLSPRSSPSRRTHPSLSPGRRFGWRQVWLAVAVLGLLATVVITLLGVGYLLDGAFRVKSALTAGETALNTADFAAAAPALETALSGLKEMKAGFPYLTYLEPMPWIGQQLVGAEAAVDASLETVTVMVTGLQVAREIFATVTSADQLVLGTNGSADSQPYSELGDDEKRLLLTGLAAALPDLRQMQVRLRLAEADLNRLNSYTLTPAMVRALEPLRQLIPDLLTSVDVLVPLAAIAPEYGGIGTDKQFLLLFLNNAELRPGGGFIGVYGLMVMRDGQIANIMTADTYRLDALVQGQATYHVNPPAPIQSYLAQSNWYFRDAAWSPDFLQTAKDAAQLLRQEVAFSGQPVPEIAGVMGLTPTFIARLLTFVGPVTVEGQTFTSENVADLLEFQVEKGFADNGIPFEQRKEIVSTLTNELVTRLLARPPSDWPSLLRIFHAGFDDKELALMSYEPKTQAALEDSGWAGVLKSTTTDDVLMVVDANLAALKTDPVVDREVTYAIVPYADGYRATATITYKHHGKFDWKTTRYRTYTRLFVPLGSTLISSTGSLKDDQLKNPGLLPGEVTVTDEAGMTSFGAFIAIEPGQVGTLSFTYDLPASVTTAIDRGTYRLSALKQLGAGDNLLTLDLNFGTNLTSAIPSESPAAFGDASYQVTSELNTDKLFTVRLK